MRKGKVLRIRKDVPATYNIRLVYLNKAVCDLCHCFALQKTMTTVPGAGSSTICMKKLKTLALPDKLYLPDDLLE
ncbi:MAG: hypothetical protein PWP72_2110 [Thermoanaerobacter sp.]|jgi:hypothetical protein|nr:hypothetical protein [Thermoanaerobacter sp.]